MTKHENVILAFLRENPSWQRKGLRNAVNKLLKAEDEELIHASLQIVPDAFVIEPNKTVRLLEVDGYSFSTPIKLQRLLNFWYELDCRSWSLEMTTIHLFTNAKSVITDDQFAGMWFDKAHLHV